ALELRASGLRRLAAGVEDDDRLAVRAHEPLILEHFQNAARHLARAADETGQLLARYLDLHSLRMGHRIRLAAQVHDRVRDAPRDVDESEIPELAVRAIEPRRELRRDLEDEPGAFGRELTEPRVSHLRDLALGARANPGAALRLLVKEAHLAE